VNADKLESTPLLDYFESIANQGMAPRQKGFVKTKESENVDELALRSFFMRKE
jgi:hypothetical protein